MNSSSTTTSFEGISGASVHREIVSRILQLPNIAGGIPLGQGDGNNNNNTTNGTAGSSSVLDSLDKVQDIFLIILSGIGVLLGIAALTYLTMMILDKISPPTDLGELDASNLARKAGLYGLTLQERCTLLEHLFEQHGRIFQYHAADYDQNDDAGGDSREEAQAEKKKHKLGKDAGNETSNNISKRNDEDAEIPDVEDQAGETADDQVGNPEKNENSNNDTNSKQPEADTAKTTPANGADESSSTSTATANANRNTDNETDGDYLDDINHDRVCCICLSAYEEDCWVMTSMSCRHMFHRDCCMEWLIHHDHCPYCRQEVLAPAQLREVAAELLGPERVADLGHVPISAAASASSAEHSARETSEEPQGIELATAPHLAAASSSSNSAEHSASPDAAGEEGAATSAIANNENDIEAGIPSENPIDETNDSPCDAASSQSESFQETDGDDTALGTNPETAKEPAAEEVQDATNKPDDNDADLEAGVVADQAKD